MRTLEDIIQVIVECQIKNASINEDIRYLEGKGELRRLAGLPDLFFAIKTNQWRLERAIRDLKVLEAQAQQ